MIGVAIDANCDDARLTAIKYGLSWPQICEGKAMKGEIARMYNVDTTPTYYVLGRDGLIVGKKVQGEELQGVVESALAAAPTLRSPSPE